LLTENLEVSSSDISGYLTVSYIIKLEISLLMSENCNFILEPEFLSLSRNTTRSENHGL